MILYFTGTGNSAYVAKKVSQVTSDQTLNLLEKIQNHDYSTIKSDKPVVFVVPTYAWKIPKIVSQWIENTNFTGNQKAYFLLTCGSGIGNAEKYIKELCTRKRWQFMGCAEIIMPENYIAMFSVPDTRESLDIIEKAKPGIDKIAELIGIEEILPKFSTGLVRKASSLINPIFYSLCVTDKKYYVTENCIGCEKCSKLCPLNNIELINGKPKWNSNCTHCMACICGCPKGAIEYGRKSLGKPRYQCPEK